MVKTMYYLNNFFMFSILGFIMETVVNLCLKNDLNSGFLYGPYTPVYGLGILIIILVNKYLDQKKLIKLKKFTITFVINTLLLTFIELIGGYLIKWCFHTSLWNYSGLPLHIGKYISIEISIIWGIISLVYIYFIKKRSDKIVEKIPNWLTYTLLFIFIIDFICTIVFKMILR